MERFTGSAYSLTELHELVDGIMARGYEDITCKYIIKKDSTYNFIYDYIIEAKVGEDHGIEIH